MNKSKKLAAASDQQSCLISSLLVKRLMNSIQGMCQYSYNLSITSASIKVAL